MSMWTKNENALYANTIKRKKIFIFQGILMLQEKYQKKKWQKRGKQRQRNKSLATSWWGE